MRRDVSDIVSEALRTDEPSKVTPLPAPNTLILREILELRSSIDSLAVNDGRWAVMLAAFQALGYALSARALLLLALTGSFILALNAHDVLTAVVLGVFATATVPPLVVLEVRKRSASE